MNPWSYIIPNEKTFFWKKIEISEIDQIHTEISNYFEKIRPTNGRSFNYIDIKKTKNACPLLFNWIKNKNLQISATVVVDVEPASGPGRFRIHVDTSDPILFPNQLALNFPVVSCIHPDVWTSMYRCKGPPDSGGGFVRYVDYIGKNGEKSQEKIINFPVDHSVEMTRFQYDDNNPILFNAKIPHAVQNYSNEARATLSLRFKVDPVWLI
jgi:hypothetical protein